MLTKFSNRKRVSSTNTKSLVLALGLYVLLPSHVYAQASEIEEILVTVQKRAELISEVPIAISAFSGDFINQVNLDDVKDLAAFTPGLTGNSQGSFADLLQIRGIYTTDYGVGGDPSIGIFKNEVFQGRNGAAISSFYDIERTEVARGSQGFLIGRNSIAGAINIFTNRPKVGVKDAYISMDAGQRNRQTIEAATNIPISANIAARLAVYSSTEDGYVEDVFDQSRRDLYGHEKEAARLSFRAELDNTTIDLISEYENRDLTGTVYRATEQGQTWQDLQSLFGVSLSGSSRQLDSDLSLGERDEGEVFNVSLNVEHDLGWATFSSITGYQDYGWQYAEDYDGTPLTIASFAQEQKGETFNQEFRLASSSGNPLTWLVGASAYSESVGANFVQAADEEIMCAYFLYEDGYANCTEYLADYDEVFVPNPDGLVERNRAVGDYSGYAAYFDLNYAFSDFLDASFGARYTYDRKVFGNRALPVESYLGPFYGLGFSTDGFLEAENSWSDLAPRALVRIRPNESWMLFGSIASGYKSGGFGSFAVDPEPEFGALDISAADFRPAKFNPEQVISYEVGSKHVLMDGISRLDLNAYFYDYEDLQVVVDGPGGGIRVDNVGQVDGWGVEAALQVSLGLYWDLYVSAAWAQSEMREVQALCGGEDICEGNGLSDLPEVSAGLVLQGEYPISRGRVFGRIEAFGQSKTYGDFDRDPDFVNHGWVDTAVRGGFRSDNGWEVVAYLENALNKKYFEGVIGEVGILPGVNYGPSRPRTAGLRVDWVFD